MTAEEKAGTLSNAYRLAGFALAQAAWSIEDGGELVPLGLTEQDGQRNAQRFVTEIDSDRLAELYGIVGAKVEPGSHGVLAFASVGQQSSGASLAILNVHIVDADGSFVGSIRQAYEPARKSRLPGRSSPFGVIGTPVPSDEIDVPGVRENVLFGVISHPEGERLFPQLAQFAAEMIAASQAGEAEA
jgi:hypothetical protein